MTLRSDSAGNIMAIAKGTQFRRHFHGRLDARIIASGDEAALIRPSHEQNVQMKSERSFRATTGDPPLSAYAAKSLKLQVGRKSSRTDHRQRQTALKLTALMAGIASSMKAFAVLWQKLGTLLSEHPFDQGNRVPVSRVATPVNIRDRVSMKAARISQIPNGPIECGPSDLMQLSRAPKWLARALKCAHLTCDKVTFATSPNQGGIQ